MFDTLFVHFLDPAVAEPADSIERYAATEYGGEDNVEVTNGDDCCIFTDNLFLQFEESSSSDLSGNRPEIQLTIDYSALRDDHRSELFDEFLAVVQLVYSAVEPAFAWGTLDVGHESVLSGSTPPPVTADDLENDRLNRPQWLTVLPPQTVETYGREELNRLSAVRVIELPDGGLLVLATEQYDEQDQYAQSITELVDSFEAIER